ncbi:MFS multidrug transporter [Seiridium cupressi]
MQSLRPAHSVNSLNTIPSQPSFLDFLDEDTSPTEPHHEEASKTEQDPDRQYVTGIRLFINMFCVVLACFLVLLDTSVVSTATPQITDDFHSLRDVGWYGSAYSLGSAAVQPLTGKIYQYFTLKWSWLVFFALFEIGSALCGAALNSNMLIIGRAIAGAGSSGILSGGFNIISACVPLERRPPLIGMMMGRPIIGGAFTTGYTWRWSFYINLPVGALVAFPIMLLRIPEQIPKEPFWKVVPSIHRRLDLLGFALFAPAVTQLLLALQFGGSQFPWSSPQIIGLFCGAGATFLVWLVWNYYKKDDALLPVSLIKRRTIWVSSLYHSLLVAAMFGVSYYLPIYFQAVQGLSAIMSGVNLLPTILPQMVLAIASGFLVTRLGFVPPFGMVAGTLTSIASGLFSTLQPDSSLARRIGFQILMGVGLGSGIQMAIVAVQNSISPREMASATAFIFWAQSMGPTIFLPLYNAILETSLRTELRLQAPHVDPQAVLEAGATRFRTLVSAEDLPSVLVAYSNSIDTVFYLVVAACGVVFCAAFGMGWKDLRKKTSNIPPPVAPTAPVPEEQIEFDLLVHPPEAVEPNFHNPLAGYNYLDVRVPSPLLHIDQVSRSPSARRSWGHEAQARRSQARESWARESWSRNSFYAVG